MPATRKKPARKQLGNAPARVGKKLLVRGVVLAAKTAQAHQETSRRGKNARQDAAILRLSHEGCKTCGGLGMIATRDKKGQLTGSKSCTATPTKSRISRWAVAKAARFGPDKDAGLYGWSCPCRAKERARFRSSADANKAITSHNRKKHGGTSVGATWFLRDPKGLAPASVPVPAKTPASKTTTANKKNPAPPKRPATPKPPTRTAPIPDANGHLHFGTDADDPTGVRTCGMCAGLGLVSSDSDGPVPCPACAGRQQARNAAWESAHGGRIADGGRITNEETRRA